MDLSIIWAAGRAGFGADKATVLDEIPAFESILDLSETTLDILALGSVCFHFLSSAGGLFETQVDVDAATHFAPLRPYGVYKLVQEAKVEALRAPIAKMIYRPSAVYGYGEPTGRVGLPIMLLKNGLGNWTTHAVRKARYVEGLCPERRHRRVRAAKAGGRRPRR
ncbi:hypothetical protein ABGN05_29470 [Aquibium sp. LZ166]|uniref:NAD-dependent epimerase/dehydratase domain-containing protein n=1 Tax=Aquibium pacificus TaxID=3153579 RepID=A0ABV3SV26_9HYPH